MKLQILKDGNNPINTNSYLIYDEESKDAYIIDAPTKTKPFIDKIEKLNLNVKYLLLTHGHWDHIYHVDFWRENYGAKIVAHKLTKDYLHDISLNASGTYIPEMTTDADIYLDGDFGEFEIFKYISTPGHSYDSISIILGNIIFCGDLIFKRSIGRTDLKGCNQRDLIESIRNKIYKFSDDIKLLPGHGENTTVGEEKMYNPFVPAVKE